MQGPTPGSPSLTSPAPSSGKGPELPQGPGSPISLAQIQTARVPAPATGSAPIADPTQGGCIPLKLCNHSESCPFSSSKTYQQSRPWSSCPCTCPCTDVTAPGWAGGVGQVWALALVACHCKLLPKYLFLTHMYACSVMTIPNETDNDDDLQACLESYLTLAVQGRIIQVIQLFVANSLALSLQLRNPTHAQRSDTKTCPGSEKAFVVYHGTGQVQALPKQKVAQWGAHNIRSTGTRALLQAVQSAQQAISRRAV